ncbi:MAG: choice-of-anchor Q domain-containing protein [Dokdonella sp.]
MTRLISTACLLLALLLGAPVNAQVFTGGNLGPIPDGGLPGPNIGGNFGPPRDVTFNVTAATGTVSTVFVQIEAVHTYVGDLRVTLIAPNGVPHILFSRTGATTETDFGVGADLIGGASYLFNDTYTTNWWTHVANNPATIPGTFARTTIEGGAGVTAPAAVTSLDAAFASTPPNGIWTLRFEDGATGDTGNVTNAVLQLVTSGGNRTVTTDADSGPGSLRQAIIDANASDLISFASPFFDTSRTINLLTALPTIDRAMAIQGPGAHHLTVRRADDAPDFRVFDINAGAATVSLSGMQISNARTSGFGGGVSSNSPLTLTSAHLSGNRAGNGGGLSLAFTSATIVNSTINGNRSQFQAGGIYRLAGGPSPLKIFGSTISNNEAGSFPGGILNLAAAADSAMEIVNSTVFGNRSPQSGGGISTQTQGTAQSSTVTLRNSLVADNSPDNFGAVANVGTATITSRGFNLSNNYNSVVTPLTSDRTGDARLGPLALNGGSVPTHALLGGSLALDNGNASAGLSLGGARGEPRTVDIASIANPNGGNGADIGAVEMQAIFVSNADDGGAGSLRQAITDANANGAGLDDILFAEPFFISSARTINLDSALPSIASALTISGPRADLLTVRRNAAADFRVFTIGGGVAHVGLSGMTISNGRDSFGGGVQSVSPLSLTNARLTGNTALPGSVGGGLYLDSADGRINNSAIDGNTATVGGAGINYFGDGGHRLVIENSTVGKNAGAGMFVTSENGQATAEVINSTIASNSSAGLFALTQGTGAGAQIQMRNNIVVDNAAQNFQVQSGAGPATIVSRGFNLTDTSSAAFLNLPSDQNNANAGLGPLVNNGGPTPSFALLASSNALDRGNAEGGSALTDQRGTSFLRSVDLPAIPNVLGDGTDIGAFESQTLPGDTIFASGFDASPPP